MNKPIPPEAVQDMVHEMQAKIRYNGYWSKRCKTCKAEVGGNLMNGPDDPPVISQYCICPYCYDKERGVGIGPEWIEHVWVGPQA